jgi:hypothetical protein
MNKTELYPLETAVILMFEYVPFRVQYVFM